MGKIPQKKSMVSADALSILGSISSFLEQAGFENSGKGLEQDCERIGVTALPKERRGRLSPLDKILSEALESILAAKVPVSERVVRSAILTCIIPVPDKRRTCLPPAEEESR